MPRKTKRTKFVPRIILGATATMTVVPAVALVNCGGQTTSQFGVAAIFDGSPNTVAASFDAGDDRFYPSVAAVFDAGTDARLPSVGASFDSGTDALPGVAAIFDSGRDAPEFTVAATFDSGEDAAQELGVAAIFDSGKDDASGDV